MAKGGNRNLCRSPGDVSFLEAETLFENHDLAGSAAAYKAAKAKDLDAVLALNEQLYNSCVYCHEDYRPNYRKRSGRKQ